MSIALYLGFAATFRPHATYLTTFDRTEQRANVQRVFEHVLLLEALPNPVHRSSSFLRHHGSVQKGSGLCGNAPPTPKFDSTKSLTHHAQKKDQFSGFSKSCAGGDIHCSGEPTRISACLHSY